jgi:uroporphyrinogen-III decarboxylase
MAVVVGFLRRAAYLAGRKKVQRIGKIMSQAIMDPEKVRRFADELQRFNTDLENRLILLQARFLALGDTWQDQEHEKFAEEFKLTMKALKKFVELSKEHTPYLLRKAQRIEEYLHQH